MYPRACIFLTLPQLWDIRDMLDLEIIAMRRRGDFGKRYSRLVSTRYQVITAINEKF